MEPKRCLYLLTILIAFTLATPAAAQIAPTGEELSVTSARGGRATAPAVAFSERGEAIIVWEAEGRGVVGRRLDVTGATGPELELAASELPDRVPFSGTVTLQRDPSVVALDDGGFLATWVEERQHVSMDIFYLSTEVLDRRIVTQRFSRTGAPAGERTVLSDGDLGLEGSPQAVRLSNGRSVVVWQTASGDGAGTGIYGRLLSRRGLPVRAIFRVDPLPDLPGSRPAVVALEDGGFLAAWQGCCDAEGPAIFARPFHARAEPAGEAFRVNTTEAGAQLWPAVDRNASGSLLVAWMGPGDAASGLDQRVYGQMMESDGTFLGPELALSRGEARAHGAPAIRGTGSGYLVAWTVWGRHFVGAIHGTELDELGAPTGGVLGLNTGPVNIQWKLAVGGDGQGRFLVAWEGFDDDGDRSINTRLLSETSPGNRSVGIAPAGD